MSDKAQSLGAVPAYWLRGGMSAFLYKEGR